MGVRFSKFPLALLCVAIMDPGNALEHTHQEHNMALISTCFEPVNLPFRLLPYLSNRSVHTTITIAAYTSENLPHMRLSSTQTNHVIFKCDFFSSPTKIWASYNALQASRSLLIFFSPCWEKKDMKETKTMFYFWGEKSMYQTFSVDKFLISRNEEYLLQ